MSHISNVRKMNEIDRLNLKEEFSSYIETLKLSKDEENKVNTFLERIFMKKNNNPDLFENNKQRLRDELKEIVEKEKKNIEDEKKIIIDEEKLTKKKLEQAKEYIIKLNSNPNKIHIDNNYDLLDPIPSNLDKKRHYLSEKLPNRKLPPISIIKDHTDNILPSSDELKFQQENYEKMKEKEKELKQRMEKLADKIGKMHTYRSHSNSKIKTVQKYHPFYDELLDIEKLNNNIKKKEERINELENKLEKMENDSAEEQKIQKEINEIKELLEMIDELEKRIDKLENKMEHSPETNRIMRRRETQRLRPSSRRARQSQSVSPHHEKEILARYTRNRAKDRKPSSSKKNSKPKDQWVKDDPIGIYKKGPFTNEPVLARRTYGGGKRTQKKHRK